MLSLSIPFQSPPGSSLTSIPIQIPPLSLPRSHPGAPAGCTVPAPGQLPVLPSAGADTVSLQRWQLLTTPLWGRHHHVEYLTPEAEGDTLV